MNILPRSFYEDDTVKVARKLIGKRLVRRIENSYIIGIISECEAYRSDDPACHAFRGKTNRNSSLFGPVGHCDVYISYGLHFCFNIVARDTQQCKAGGVLIRAVFPIAGIDLMYNFRPVPFEILADGPGKLTQAFNIDMSHNGLDLTDLSSDVCIIDSSAVDESFINQPSLEDQYILATPRIGISVAKEKLWRFVLSKK